MSDADDDLVLFADDDHSEPEPKPGALADGWRILIVDDDEQVHQATRYALKDTLFVGKPLVFFSVHSAAEAKEALAQDAGFAVILLDVVMESHDAGLNLVSYIRETCEDLCARIILRTGQPGYVPEVEAIQKYDINDYKSKAELTRSRLITSVTAAIRAYQQLQTIENSRRGLTQIIGSASELFKERAISSFSQGVVIQLCSLLQIDEEGFVCCHFEGSKANTLKVLAGGGRFYPGMVLDLGSEEDDSLIESVKIAYRDKRSSIQPERVVLHVVSPNGDELVVHVSIAEPLSDIDQQLLELFSINIAVGFDNARMFEYIEKLAFVDDLTGLPNLSSLSVTLQARLEQAQPCVLVLFDLDSFQSVNDGLGREMGDLVLGAVATRLQDEFADCGLVARNSGDTFAVLVDSDDWKDVEKRVRQFVKRLDKNIEIEGSEVPLSVTAGLAVSPEHGTQAETLVQNAGIALKEAKRTQRASCCIFDPGYEEALQDRLRIGRELRHCIESKELFLHFQPQISLRRQRVVGVEALVRWRKNNQIISPAEFIPIAENSGHIIAIGSWVMEEACRTQVQLRERLGQDIVMAVNVSVRQLKDHGFFSVLDGILRRTGITPAHLELEITESMMVSDTATFREVLLGIQARGICVAIDDFGTGYSSLSYLQRLPIDRLKIDRSFVTDIHDCPEDRAIAALVVEMAHLLKLNVIAEGVETEQQESQLRRLGCDEVQGFLYAKPMEREALIAFVTHFRQVW